MSHKDNILQCLQRLQYCVINSLIYQLILYCDKVTFSDNIINVYAVKREFDSSNILGSLSDLIFSRVLLKIILIDGQISVWLPHYYDKQIYSCNIDKKYVIDDNKLKLCSIFQMLYKDIFNKLENCVVVNVCKSLLMVGIVNNKIQNHHYVIRIVDNGNMYTDISTRLQPQYEILFEDILYFRINHEPNRILSAFRGLLMNDEVDDKIARGIVYLKSDNAMTIKDLSRFPSLMYADIVCDYDVSLCKRFKSLRINNTMVQGQSPCESFLKSK